MIIPFRSLFFSNAMAAHPLIQLGFFYGFSISHFIDDRMFSMHLLVDKYNGGSAEAPAIIIFRCATIVLHRPIDGADRDTERETEHNVILKKTCVPAPGVGESGRDASFKNECIRHIQLILK